MPQEQPRQPTSDQVRNALRAWHENSDTGSTLSHLYIFRLKLRQDPARSVRRATNQLLFDAMEQMRGQHEEDVTLLRMRFLDLFPVHQMANHHNVADSTFYVMQRKAINRLAEVLRDMETIARRERKQRLDSRLEPSGCGELVGVDETVDDLLGRLTRPDAPWIVSLEGIGGIGKTTLANCIVRRVIDEHLIDEMAWVSARQEFLGLDGELQTARRPALTSTELVEALARQLAPELVAGEQYKLDDLLKQIRIRLRDTPHLVVIDNLETLNDVETLLPTLTDLGNPSKFLLTTRESPYALPNVHHVQIQELSAVDAIALMRHEAALRNLPLLAGSDEEVLQGVYDVVGGNPLALRLVVGQNHIYTLDVILHNLREAVGDHAENLFTYIYRSAWDKLDAASRDLLLVMPLVAPLGDALSIIAEIGGMTERDVHQPLNQLVTLNLVDARDGLHDRRYSIHSLTRTFLHKQVLAWQ